MLTQGLRKLTAEVFGTFCLVFVGTGAIVINDVSGGTVSHVGIALTFGLIVLAMIYALGDVSGCHLNPAVTLGFFIARRFGGRMVGPYIVSQCIGAILASITIRLMFPTNAMLGATHTSKSLDQFNGREVEVAVTMGCGDECPLVKAKRREEWQIPDPKEMPPELYREVRDLIERKVKELLAEL